MTTAVDNVRTVIAGRLGSGWVVQFGRWLDRGPALRHCVIRPAGGLPARLTREPQFTVLLVAALADPETAAHEAASDLVQYLRGQSADLVYLEAAEPVSSATGDGRPTSEFAVSAITD